MNINTSYSISMYEKSEQKNNSKLVKSLSDFNQVIHERNKQVFQEVTKNGINFNNDGTFKSNLIKGSNIDVYA